VISRREFVKRGLQTTAVLASGLPVACGRGDGPDGARTLRIMINGGLYEEVARRIVIGPFERETGARVEVVPASAAEMLTRLRAERGSPSVDLVVIDQLVGAGGIEDGLFERIDAGNIPNLGDLSDEAIDPAGYGPIVHCHGELLGVNRQRLDTDPPRSWADLWDPRFKGLIVPGAIELTPGVCFLLEANALNGGTYANLDPGFAAVRRLAPNIRKYFHSIGEVRSMLANENIIAAVSSNITQAEADQGAPIETVFPEEGSIASPAVAQIVGGTRVKELAERFIDRYLDPDVQLEWARQFYLSVFNRKTRIPDDLRARIARKLVFLDAREVVKHREAWVDRWVREVRG